MWRHTRIMSKFGRKRYRSHDSRGVLPGKRSIAERPAEVDARRRRGHWEGDTVMGSDMRHCVLTLVERKTGFAIIKKLSARNTDEVTRAATRALRHHCHKFKTLTLDNGTEFHNYAVLEQHFPLKIYFATPYHSWERGSNENLNGAAAISAERHLHARRHPGPMRSHRRRSQQRTKETIRLRHTSKAISSKLNRCCTCSLNLRGTRSQM